MLVKLLLLWSIQTFQIQVIKKKKKKWIKQFLSNDLDIMKREIRRQFKSLNQIIISAWGPCCQLNLINEINQLFASVETVLLWNQQAKATILFYWAY